jgi:hypothetical protein
MGNTPSTPPPLVSINAPGNDVLVPYGTSLYAYPPQPSGYHAPHAHCGHQQGACQGASCPDAGQGLIYSRVSARPRRQRHGRPEPDVRIREYEESESTELGEVRPRRKEREMQDMRRPGPGLYDAALRPSSAPAGYAGLRGGQAQPGVYPSGEEMVVNGMPHPVMYAGGNYPGGYPQGPNMSPHLSVPPQYASYESMPGYPQGMGHAQNANVYASHPPRPPPPSTTSSSSISKSRGRQLPSAIQAAIDEAILKSTGTADRSSNLLSKSKTWLATPTKDNNDGWGDGIDKCICTTNCKCRKGERAIKWYEGMAKIGGEDVPVRAKLNTRYVLKDDIGKDCGDHSGCKKKSSSNPSSSSSSSDTETSKSKKDKRKHKRRMKKAGRDDALDDLQVELEKMKQAAAMKQGGPYGAPPFTGYGPGNPERYDPKTMKQMMEMSDPYGIGRVGSIPPTGKMQGIYDSMTTRNPRLPRIPPEPGMRMRSEDDGFLGDYEDLGGASPLNPYARPSAMRGKGQYSKSMPPKRRPRFRLRKDVDSDSEPITSIRSRDSKKGGLVAGQPRRYRAFELDDTDVSLGPRRQSAMRAFCSDRDGEPAMYNLPSKSCIVSVFGLRLAETSIERGGEVKDGSGSPRNGLPRISPTGRRSGVHQGRTAGKQARAESDDEDY